MPSATDIILNIVCPLLGTITAYQMFLAPFPDVQKAIHRGSLNDLNPLPWAFLMGNCLGWVLYSVLTQNIWLLVANAPGFLIAVYFNLAASNLQYQHQFQILPTIAANDMAVMPAIPEDDEGKYESHGSSGDSGESGSDEEAPRNSPNDSTTHKTTTNSNTISAHDDLYKPLSMEAQNVAATDGDGYETASTSGGSMDALQPGAMVSYKVPSHAYWIMGIISAWTAILALIGFAQSFSPNTKQLIVGLITNFNLLFFYGAPLSTIADILKTRNTATIHVPTMTMNTVNSCFWTAYGFAIMDFFVLVPNGIGACLGFAQVFLYMTFPRKSDDTPNTIAATVVVGDAMADAVVMGDPTSEDAIIMMNRDDVHRLQHSIAVDEKLGGVQIVTSGVPAFSSTVEPSLIDRRVRRNSLNHRRCVTFAGIPAGVYDSDDNSAAAAAAAGGNTNEANDTETPSENTTTPAPLSSQRRGRHGRSASAGAGHLRNSSYSGVPLINLSEHRRQASASAGGDGGGLALDNIALDQTDYDTFLMFNTHHNRTNSLTTTTDDANNNNNNPTDVENPSHAV